MKNILGEARKLAVPFVVLTVLDNVVGSFISKPGGPQTVTGQVVGMVSGIFKKPVA